MPQNLRSLKLRIRSIENTQKITRAMEMVSSSKLNRAKAALFAHLPYFLKLDGMLKHILSSIDLPGHPFFEKRDHRHGRVALCLVTSDTGLCSTYNQSAIRHAEHFIEKHGRGKVTLVNVGLEGHKHFRQTGIKIHSAYTDLHGRFSKDAVMKISSDLIGLFLEKKVDEAYIAYTHFGGVLMHKPVLEKILNIDLSEEPVVEYLAEPDLHGIIDIFVPLYIREKICHCLRDAFTSEHAARMVAMKSAKDNAKELIEKLTLLRNKARQAAITNEIIEIAMSAEALKG